MNKLLFFRSKPFLLIIALLLVITLFGACSAAATTVQSIPSDQANAADASDPPQKEDAELDGAATNDAIESAGTSSEPTPSPAPTPAIATLVASGDIVPHKTVQLAGLHTDNVTYDFTELFSAIVPQVTAADVSVLSLESALVEQPNNYTGYPLFNTPPVFADAIAACGFDILNNNNNHSLDRHLTGFATTRENAEESGLAVLGYVDEGETRYQVYDENGIRIAIMAYTYSYNGNEAALTAAQQAAHLALFDETRMKAELEEMESVADVSVVCMHWGVEYRQDPNAAQKDLAAKLFSWGADVILGSHPHVVQPSEMMEVDGEMKYIHYAMGNFVSNQRRGASGLPNTHKELAEDSMLVHVTFEKDMETGKTVIQEVVHEPTWLWRYEEDGTYRFVLVPIAALDDPSLSQWPSDVQDEAKASYLRTMPMMTDYHSAENE